MSVYNFGSEGEGGFNDDDLAIQMNEITGRPARDGRLDIAGENLGGGDGVQDQFNLRGEYGDPYPNGPLSKLKIWYR